MDEAQKDSDVAADICKRFENLKSSRVNWDNHWDEVAKYIIPKKDNIYGYQIEGEQKYNFLYDSTSIHANELLASALHSMLTNPSLKWFFLSTGDPEIDRKDTVAAWLQSCVDKIHEVLNSSNFQTEIHETYLDLGSFGTNILLIEEDDKDYVRFFSKPIYEGWVEENSKGVIDTVFRTYKYTVRQTIDEFGEGSLPKEYVDSRLNSNEKLEIIHAVFPRKQVRPELAGSRNLKSAPYASFHIWKGKKKLLKESGYWEYPYAVPRWTKTSSETYGRSPGMKVLPPIRMINAMKKTLIRGAQKVVDPALAVTDDGSYRPIKMTPGGINYLRPGSQIVPIETRANISIGLEMIKDVKEEILQGFFIDQLQLNDGPQMTATEVRQRTEEKLRLLGPILGRQQNELLRPMIDRIFGILLRRGILPPIPVELEKLQGKELKVQYSSTIARVQKTSESENLLRALGAIQPLLQNDPTILDNINGDEAFRYTADLFGVPMSILNKKKDIEAQRNARAQAQQQQQSQEQDMQQADMVGKMAPAMKQ